MHENLIDGVCVRTNVKVTAVSGNETQHSLAHSGAQHNSTMSLLRVFILHCSWTHESYVQCGTALRLYLYTQAQTHAKPFVCYVSRGHECAEFVVFDLSIYVKLAQNQFNVLFFLDKFDDRLTFISKTISKRQAHTLTGWKTRRTVNNENTTVLCTILSHFH